MSQAAADTLTRWAGLTLFGKSPANAYVRWNRRLWRALPPAVTARAPLCSYGRFLHRVVAVRAERRQCFATAFFRNRPQLRLIRALAERCDVGATLRVAFLACSTGAELYSVLWTIRSARPDLTVRAAAVDISEEILAVAQRGVYPASVAGLDLEERRAMFEPDGNLGSDGNSGEARIVSWLREGIRWHHADAADPDLSAALGPQHIVLANNFLCHMNPPDAERCLRNIARLVAPGGHLCVSGVDLDVRTTVARDLGWSAVRDALQAIHDGDPSLRKDWPLQYWGLEPFDARRSDGALRYASVFQRPITVDRCPC